MYNFNDEFKKFGIAIPELYLPNKDVNMQKWSIIACDQFTSEKEYWDDASNLVADSPSTLNLIYPECYLEDGDEEERIKNIEEHMNKYLKEDIIQASGKFFVLVRRETSSAQVRWGLVSAIDLEKYDFSVGSTSLVRATEGTIIERIPPRVKIRENAKLEFPHIMILLNDNERGIVEPLIDKANNNQLEKIYDFDLMFGSGNIKGFKVDKENDLIQLLNGFASAGDLAKFKNLYNNENLLMYAVGDGNHSLATAKTIWEDKKKTNHNLDLENDPARWALVELNNIYDAGIEFEPIHRVLFDIDKKFFIEELKAKFEIKISKNISDKALEELALSIPETQQFALLSDKSNDLITILNPSHSLTAGTIQNFIDELLKNNKDISIDYIHGIDSTKNLTKGKNNLGIILPNISKDAFFETVIKDGTFPRKTFSMGQAKDKRFYIEGKVIQ